MSDKHEVLTDTELIGFDLHPQIIAGLEEASVGCGDQAQSRNVLDWGCGRGRSVAKLIEYGFHAIGVDSDENVLHNGFALFEARGLDPSQILLHLEDLDRLPDGHFCFVFSEETIEHVFPLEQMARETFRVTAPGGVGLHSFPGSKRVMEPHLRMPFVHWFDTFSLQKRFVQLCLRLGFGPEPEWPQTAGMDTRETAQILTEYLRDRTCYRDAREIVEVFRAAGFVCELPCGGVARWWSRFLPRVFRNNGFPDGQLLLNLRRPV